MEVKIDFCMSMMNGWTDEQINGQMKEKMDEWTDGQTDE